jgi:hypothetical protein
MLKIVVELLNKQKAKKRIRLMIEDEDSQAD